MGVGRWEVGSGGEMRGRQQLERWAVPCRGLLANVVMVAWVGACGRVRFIPAAVAASLIVGSAWGGLSRLELAGLGLGIPALDSYEGG